MTKPSRFKRPPPPVVACVAIVVTLIVALAPSETHPGAPFAVVMLLGASAGLIFGFGLAWLFLVVIEPGNLLVAVLDGQPWRVVLVKALMVALLLRGSARRHFWWPRRGRVAAGSG